MTSLDTTPLDKLNTSWATPKTPNFRLFFGKALVAAALVALAMLGALAGAKAFGLLPQTKVAVNSTTGATAPTGPSASIDHSVNYKWTQILGPNGTKIWTQCSSEEKATRTYLTSTGNLSFRADAGCK